MPTALCCLLDAQCILVDLISIREAAPPSPDPLLGVSWRYLAQPKARMGPKTVHLGQHAVPSYRVLISLNGTDRYAMFGVYNGLLTAVF